MTEHALAIRQDQTLSTTGLTAGDVFDLKLCLERLLRTYRYQFDNISKM
jgi:hypothetical protein